MSRLDVSNTYLDQLASKSRNLQERLTVKRSRIFHLKDPEERIQLAVTIAELAILELASYNRTRKSGLVDTLYNA